MQTRLHTSDAADSAGTSTSRLVSIDVYRGSVMFLMLAEVLHFEHLAKAHPGNLLLEFLGRQQSHVEWRGCTLHDLIQPSFTFLVGVSLAFSLRKRLATGQSKLSAFGHAAWRAFALVVFGLGLRALFAHSQWTFEDTLTQIGLGYLPLFVLATLPRWVPLLSLLVILLGYWLAFAAFPLPPPNYDYLSVGVALDWPFHLDGFAQHWDKNVNLAAVFDRWFLNHLPWGWRFEHNPGGYATLNFIPTLGTMLLGLIAGRLLQRSGSQRRIAIGLVCAGIGCGTLGWLLDILGVCPSVKRIWTPSWVLLSGGWCLAILGLLHAWLDGKPPSRWFFPLLVVGANSILAYALSWIVAPELRLFVRSFASEEAGSFHSVPHLELFAGTVTLVALWVVLYLFYRQRWFVKI